MALLSRNTGGFCLVSDMAVGGVSLQERRWPGNGLKAAAKFLHDARRNKGSPARMLRTDFKAENCR